MWILKVIVIYVSVIFKTYAFIHQARTANMSWSTYVVIKQMQSNPINLFTKWNLSYDQIY